MTALFSFFFIEIGRNTKVEVMKCGFYLWSSLEKRWCKRLDWVAGAGPAHQIDASVPDQWLPLPSQEDVSYFGNKHIIIV